MTLSSDQIMRYLALLGDPEQNKITREAWTVATKAEDLVWAGWQPESVVSVNNEPPPEWYSEKPPPGVSIQRAVHARGDREQSSPMALLSQFGLRGSERIGKPSIFDTGMREQLDLPDVEEPVTPPPGVKDRGLERLASLDELHHEESLGRIGWLFISGTIRVGDQQFPCCFPLFERRARFVRVEGEFYPQWKGALQRNNLLRRRVDDSVEDPVDTFLASGAGRGDASNIGSKLASLLAHFDVVVTSVLDPEMHPLSVKPEHGTVLVPGVGFYLARPASTASATQNDLKQWQSRHLGATAFAELYRTPDSTLHDEQPRESPIRSALPLNDRQRQAIDRLDTETVVAVSGPPGTGKTHMIVAAAADAVAHGLSVLIATKSDFAAESACELLDKYYTPPYVRFGRDEHRRRVADLLSDGSSAGVSEEQIDALVALDDERWTELEGLGHQVLGALERKQAFERAITNEHLPAAAGAPRLVEPGFDFRELDRTFALAQTPRGVRQRRAINKLRKMLGAPEGASIEAMSVAITGATAEVAIRKALDHAKGTELDALWEKIDNAELEAKTSRAAVDIARHTRPTREGVASTAALATALRASLSGTPLQLPAETTTGFLHHLPFWVGTLDEIEATLPANPAMFDLVIFDEASQIDQLSAVPALCRATRAFIVGDPRQLRHTSTITQEQIGAARLHAGLAPGADAVILDIAANSLFDVAASATPVTWLNEHFRSIPHLIQFASDRWYGGDLRLMTQHPRNERLDVIHMHRVPTRRTDQTHVGEVAAIIDLLRWFRENPEAAGRSIGVITPFTEQAQALEQAIVASFGYDAIRDMKLRVGTVRGVQGTERDTILVSLVVDERDFGEALQMVEDPHVFNVMTTRARSQMHVFHSFDPAQLPAGVLADWFRYENDPPGLSGQLSASTSAWTQGLAEALELGGVRVVAGYPVAGWSIDLVVGEGAAAFGVETTVHPDGPQAHAERHLMLRRAGWDLVSMFESNWLLQTEEAAVYLASIAARRAQTTRA